MNQTQNTMKHTKGPWIVQESDYKGLYEISGDLGMMTGEQHEANARLIAAAPEMLEALKGALRMYQMMIDEGWQFVDVDNYEAIKQAIAKAES